MAIDDLLGRRALLRIKRFGPPGAYLDAGDGEDLLLIGHETPREAKVGDAIDAFVHLDSEGRPIATTREAKLSLGEVAFLRVTSVTRVGAFFDWGLAKELLVPFAEQTVEHLDVGHRHAIGLYRDDSGRLAGTMKVSEMLDRKHTFRLDQRVEGEAWRFDPAIGLFVILQRRFLGLVPASEPHGLSRGQAATFRIASILRDGKIELSLRGHAHEELADDAATVLAFVSRPDAPRIGDGSSPDDIRDELGLSKKAFKRAVGRLLKEGKVRIDDDGFVLPV